MAPLDGVRRWLTPARPSFSPFAGGATKAFLQKGVLAQGATADPARRGARTDLAPRRPSRPRRQAEPGGSLASGRPFPGGLQPLPQVLPGYPPGGAKNRASKMGEKDFKKAPTCQDFVTSSSQNTPACRAGGRARGARFRPESGRQAYGLHSLAILQHDKHRGGLGRRSCR